MTNAVLKANGFINEISKYVSPKGDTKYFVKVSVPHGTKETRRYQYLSVFVGSQVRKLIQNAFENQTFNEGTANEGRANNIFTGQLVQMDIEAPFFELSEGKYLNGSGILTNITFNTQEDA